MKLTKGNWLWPFDASAMLPQQKNFVESFKTRVSNTNWPEEHITKNVQPGLKLKKGLLGRTEVETRLKGSDYEPLQKIGLKPMQIWKTT